jgi:C1A family cysteine protease
MAVELAALQHQIADLGLRWHAGVTTNSDHSEMQARSRTGYVPGPDDLSLEEAERIAGEAQAAAVAAAAAGSTKGVGAPPLFDWRNRGGQSFVTPITDQGGCGSCVAFGAVAAMESLVRITLGSPTAGVDLSEAHLWFCWGPSHGAGACPAGGWWPDAAYDGLTQGIVDEACFPYTDANQACNLCPDWQSRLTKITGWHKLSTQADMKAFIYGRPGECLLHGLRGLLLPLRGRRLHVQPCDGRQCRRWALHLHRWVRRRRARRGPRSRQRGSCRGRPCRWPRLRD